MLYLGARMLHGHGIAGLAVAGVRTVFGSSPVPSWSGLRSLITADGIRHAPPVFRADCQVLWIVTVFVGLMVMLPSQMSIVDDFSRRWTDILWSGSRRSSRHAQGAARSSESITEFSAFTYCGRSSARTSSALTARRN